MNTDKETKKKGNLPIFSVIHWVLFSMEEPPDIVEEYITINSRGEFAILEWYEGDCFKSCMGGHWSDEDGNEVKDIILWAEKPCV